MRWLMFFNLALLLSGCLVGPNYQPPLHQVPECWSTDSNPLISDLPPPVEWWKSLNDPVLDQLILLAVSHNQNLMAAETTICQARAIRKMKASALFPHIEADINATRTHFSKNGPVFAIGMGQTSSATGLPFQLQIPKMQNIYNALIDMSWEIDFFGKTRRAIESACAKIGSAIEYRNDILVRLIAEVAIHYVELRSYQQRGLLIEENIQLLEQNAAVVRKQFEAGYINKINLETIEAEIALASSQLPPITGLIYQTIYALSVLTGHYPETLLCQLFPIVPLTTPCKELILGLRSNLIRRRPDIRRAERDLAAATADIGVAVASFFPSFVLSADIGFQSLNLRNLFQAQSLTWALGGAATIPIYQGGNLVGNLQLAKWRACEAYYKYNQAILKALEEAESSLIGYTEELKAFKSLENTIDRYQALVQINQKRYTKGLTNLINLLDSQRQLNRSKQDLLTSHIQALINFISLYKALGGGWEPCD